MSGDGRPTMTVPQWCEDLRLAVVATRWHETITTNLLERALTAAAKAGVKEPT
ncbi:MAG TPA: 6,7-dimethyl-8-ribityllumazine synthase, partial [Kutzneria sp.]